MNVKESVNILSMITHVYTNFEITKEKAQTWTWLLSKYDYETVRQNFEKFAVESQFPPTIADLVRGTHGNPTKQKIDVEQIEREREEMRKRVESLGDIF